MAKVEKRYDGEPCWFDLMTPDREGAKKFYGSVFGWDFADADAEGMPYTMALRQGGPVAGIGSADEESGTPCAWTVYFQTPDVASAGATVKATGGSIIAGPVEVSTHGKMALCTDPEGSVFGLWQAGVHPGSAYVGDHGSMCWCEVNVRDAQKARTFYDSLFKTKSERLPAEGMTYFTFQNEERNRPQAGVLQMTEEWGDMPAHWMAYFAVEDTDASCETIKKAGGEVKHGPFDTPFGRMAVVSDPVGAVFTVIKPAPGS